MNGAMMSATSRLAMASAVGLLLSLGSAQAADLGGNCCADLEERVAELEATTARKGNRKVSLTISGQVNKAIVFIDDGIRSRTIAGVDNTLASSRFVFSGNAKISPSHTAGFELMVEWAGSNRTQDISTTTTLVQNWSTFTATPNSSGDGSLAIRTANWWLEDKMLGRVTVGRVNLQGPASIIDISGGDLGVGPAGSNPLLQGGGISLSQSGSTRFLTNSIGTIAPWCYGCSREEGIRYDSASFGGLTFGFAWGEQDVFTAQARFATEMHGFQIAAGAGYQHDNNLAGFGNDATLPTRLDREQQAYALSIKHVASGIFVQGNTGRTNWNRVAGVENSGKNDGTMWQIQGGISRNWFGPGATTFYGEYGHGQGYGSGSQNNALTAQAAAANAFFTTANAGAATFITSDKLDYYGLGMTQKIDAAAMTMYLGWRHYDPEITTNAGNAGSLNGIDMVMGGARIQF